MCGAYWSHELGARLSRGQGAQLCTKLLEACWEDLDIRERPRYRQEIFHQST